MTMQVSPIPSWHIRCPTWQEPYWFRWWRSYSYLLIDYSGRYAEVLLNFFLFVLITPVFSQNIMKNIYINQALGQASEAIGRLDSLLSYKELPVSTSPRPVTEFDIRFDKVSFTYPGAAQKAVDNVSFSIPQGYQTVIGENGDTLSGGERQRISIACALLKDAPIVLLDEATASLDMENETRIQAGISELVHNKTVLIIAHRMRTIANADKIVVLENGGVAEAGTPDDLKARGGLFARMVKRQTEQ